METERYKYSAEDRELDKKIKAIDFNKLKQQLNNPQSESIQGHGDSTEWVHHDDDLSGLDFSSMNPHDLARSLEGKSLHHVNLDEAVSLAAAHMGTEKTSAALMQASIMSKAADGVAFVSHKNKNNAANVTSQTGYKLSQNQVVALKKFPALIDLLGSEGGEKIVKEILAKVTELVVTKIASNSQKISKFAQSCISERQNIKQYFVGENQDWVCCVIASGPFRGDEAIYFDPDNEVSSILRAQNDDYVNVTSEFNLVHEFARR